MNARLSTRPWARGVFLRSAALVTMLAMLLSTSAIARAEPASPFVGSWRATDWYDGSEMRLSIAGPAEGPFRVTLTDDFMSFCQGGPGLVWGTGALDEEDAYVLEADLRVECRTSGASMDYAMTWTYQPEADTLSSRDDEAGVETIWSRPGPPPEMLPYFVASAAGDFLWTQDFAADTELNITVFACKEACGSLWRGLATTDESGFAFVDSSLDPSFVLEPGNYVTVTGAGVTKDLVLLDMSVTVFNTVLNTMEGRAPAGARVWVAAGLQPAQTGMWVTAVGGVWSVDFNTMDPPLDITKEMRPWSYAQIYDKDGDINEADPPWPEGPMPYFVAYVPGAVEGYAWPMRQEVSIQISRGDDLLCTATAQSEQRPDFPEGETRVLFQLGELCKDVLLQPGDRVEMADSTTTKETTVTSLAVTDFNVGAGTVSGIFDPRYDLRVSIAGEPPEELERNEATWTAQFTELTSGDPGEATQNEIGEDGDGDGTSIDFVVP